MPNALADRANKNRLLVKFRRWHTWGGLLLSLLILLVAATGIVLNHADVLLPGGVQKAGTTGALTTSTDLASLPVRFDQAIALARRHFGDVALDKVELKDEHGRLVYKVSRGRGKEIRIDAGTGEVSSKYTGNLEVSGQTTLHWPKIVKDLHTGMILGTFGRLAVDVTGGVIIALSLTGIYLWAMPVLRKRRDAKNRQTAAGLDGRQSFSEAAPESC